MPRTDLVDVDVAVDTARSIGYPVAVKALGRRIGRSVEAGIALDLSDDGDVETSVAAMRQSLGDDAARVYVQRMVPPGVDLRIRATRDPRLGPLITVGIGGSQADAIGDETSRLAPISPSTARTMIAATRAAALLDDQELDLVADQVTRVAQLVSDHDRVAELDLNPVIVSDAGSWVADARDRTGRTRTRRAGTPPTRMSADPPTRERPASRVTTTADRSPPTDVAEH